MHNPFSLKGKRIFVTGASSGIGRAIAIECSKMDAELVITARNEVRLAETFRLMNHDGLEHKIIAGDLSNEDDIERIVDFIPDKLDGIVQCAGFTIPKPFKNLSKDNFEAVMKVNFWAPALLTQQLLKRKKIEKAASIVFISSISGVFCSSVGGNAYSSSKGAINGMAKNLALELAPQSIRVNSVNPGMIHTGIFASGVISQEQLQEDMKKYPLGRYGKPEEVAYAVIYLLSDASAWVTGSNLLIDGGYTCL
ncbi:MAG: SDR family oxidoreductase [Bacteroidales bacterium]|jgi:NAD(P)-dependent dehydrogenase (short-subunit alcohol dehydrogenase family)|nr:SDR family oxidoreductase [Bacteroidales bacterium]